MTLKIRILLVIASAFALAAAITACGQPTTYDIVQTQTAQNKIDNATATAEAQIALGLDPNNPLQRTVGEGSVAQREQQRVAATQTAIAQAGGTLAGTPIPQSGRDIEVPDGPALTDADSPTVVIAVAGKFEPEIIKVAVGTTVTWTNERRSASTSTSVPGEDEQWDSGNLFKGTFATEAASFSHTFTVPGCHRYQSLQSGDTSSGAVCVVE